ncbi:MAG TPA: hypothetical protein VMG81_03335 [Thermoplasmata archaeon]|nr:hypothetical protein [Thermoplasmata archaeon]
MAEVPSIPSLSSAAPTPRRRCYLSRHRGWIDPERPSRPTYEVNLLAVALNSRVWTLGTAWESIFRSPMPRPIAEAFRKAMARVRLTDRDVDLLRGVADGLRVDLVVSD